MKAKTEDKRAVHGKNGSGKRATRRSSFALPDLLSYFHLRDAVQQPIGVAGQFIGSDSGTTAVANGQ